MGKIVDGEIECHIAFHGLYVDSESDGDIIDALFPEGYEGEMLDQNITFNVVRDDD